MRVVIRDPYDVPPEAFWGRMFFDPAYNQSLYTEGLGFESLEILEDAVTPDGSRRRRMRVRPRLDMPAAVKKLVGEKVTYVEEGTFDAAAGTFRSRIVPSSLADRIRIETVMRLEPRGAGACERIAEAEVEVRVLGLGGLVEKFIEKSLRDNYAKGAAFSNRWLAARLKT